MTFYRQHHLTVAEILEIFNYADQNRDGQISTEEWDEFHRIFISEFEANDADKDYKLSHEELKKLLRSSESLNKIAYRTQISRTFAGMKDHEKEQDFKKSMEDDEKNEGKNETSYIHNRWSARIHEGWNIVTNTNIGKDVC
jgi:Ca2+-binding EF-hand superfamily protein